MAHGDAELDHMIDAFGVDATIGGETRKVLVDKVGEEIQPGVAAALEATKIALTYKNPWPAAALGVVIVVAGKQFSPYELFKITDGTMTRAFCERR